jgi:DNA-binding protein, histone-like, putative
MSVLYKLLPIYDNINSNPKKGMTVRPVSRGTVSLSRLTKKMANETPLKQATLKAVIEELAHQVEEALMEGYHVNLGRLGTFSLSVESNRLVESPKEIRAESVSIKRILFRPSAEMTKQVKKAALERAPEMIMKLKD